MPTGVFLAVFWLSVYAFWVSIVFIVFVLKV